MKNYSDEYYDNPNQRVIDDSTYMFIETLGSVEAKDVYIDDVLAKAYITNSTNPNNENKEERIINVLVEQPIKTGSYIKGYDEGIYLVISGVDNHISHKEAKIRKCNYILKWMDENGLHEQPSIVMNNTKYTGGTKSQSEFVEVSAMVNITTQSNADTNKITYGKRLFTMKNAWQVTLIDNITTENVLSWTLGKDSINYEIDDTENGICDAFTHSYAITLNSTSESIQVNGTYQIISSVTDRNVIVTNPNITYTSSDENIATVNLNGLVTAIGIGNAIITASIGNVNVTLSLEVTAKTVTPVVSYSYDWSMGTTFQTYVASTAQCNKYINGIKQDGLVISYDIDSIGQSLVSNGKIAITQPSNSSIQIRNKSVSTTTTFTINIKDSSDGTLIKSQVITLTGM